MNKIASKIVQHDFLVLTCELCKEVSVTKMLPLFKEMMVSTFLPSHKYIVLAHRAIQGVGQD